MLLEHSTKFFQKICKNNDALRGNAEKEDQQLQD